MLERGKLLEWVGGDTRAGCTTERGGRGLTGAGQEGHAR